MINEAREGNMRRFAVPAVSHRIVKGADRVQVDIRTSGDRIVECHGRDVRTQSVLPTGSAW